MKKFHYRIKKGREINEPEISGKINTCLELLHVAEEVKEDLFQEAWLYYLESPSTNPDVGSRLLKLWSNAKEREGRGDVLAILSVETKDVCRR